MIIELKSKEQIDTMDEANQIVHSVLDFAQNTIKIGMKSEELDALMEEELDKVDGATSAFKGYKNYPKVSCISVNSVVVHGIPNDTLFEEGDVVSIDFGVYFKGYAGDSARTFILGKPNKEEDSEIVKVTKQSLLAGIDQMWDGNHLHDIGKAIDDIGKSNGYGNIRNFSGHGIGTAMHEPPSVFNYIEPKQPNIRLRNGMALALEPMFSLGDGSTTILSDNWTVVCNNISVHWELSIAITESGPRILGTTREKYDSY